MDKLNKVLLNPALKLGADFDGWLATGGGLGLEAALAAPESVIACITAAELRGMGGAGFPTAANGMPQRAPKATENMSCATATATSRGLSRTVICYAGRHTR